MSGLIWHFIPHSVVNCRYSLYSPGKFVCVKKWVEKKDNKLLKINMIENDSISVILLFPYRCRFSLSFMAKKQQKRPW